MELRTSVKTQRVYTVVEGIAVAAAIARIKDALINISSTCIDQETMSVFAGFGNDIDHAIYSVRSPDGGTWPPDHFNTLDILQHHVLYFPICPREQGGVDCAPVDEHQDVSGEIASESPNADGPLVAVDLCHLNPRREPQCLRNSGRPGRLNVFIVDHVDGRGGFPNLLRFLGHRRDFHIPQLR
jgi:hypothetical protein